AVLGEKRALAHLTKAQGAKARAVRYSQQIVEFGQRAGGTAFAFGALALGTLHEPPSPGVWRGVPDRAIKANGWGVRTATELKRGLERERFGMIEPVRVIFEHDRRAVSTTLGRIESSDTLGGAGQLDMNFDVSHFPVRSSCGA